MTDLDRMNKLMGILALAFAWCLIAGHWHYGDPLNKHWRPAKALFRLGLDMLRRVLKNECSKSDLVRMFDWYYIFDGIRQYLP